MGRSKTFSFASLALARQSRREQILQILLVQQRALVRHRRRRDLE